MLHCKGVSVRKRDTMAKAWRYQSGRSTRYIEIWFVTGGFGPSGPRHMQLDNRHPDRYGSGSVGGKGMYAKHGCSIYLR